MGYRPHTERARLAAQGEAVEETVKNNAIAPPHKKGRSRVLFIYHSSSEKFSPVTK